MPFIVSITLTSAGLGTGPTFDLYSNVDSYTTPFETGVPKASLTGGYSATNVPDGTTIIKVVSVSGLCPSSNVLIPIAGIPSSPTPTVTPSISVTPTITPTVSPSISVTPTVTPSITITPSVTVTPTISVTPSSSGPGGTSFIYAGGVSGWGTFNLACSNKTCGRAYYRNAPFWSVGQTVWDNNALTVPFNGGDNWYAINTGTTFCSGTQWVAARINSSGIIIDLVVCP